MSLLLCFDTTQCLIQLPSYCLFHFSQNLKSRKHGNKRLYVLPHIPISEVCNEISIRSINTFKPINRSCCSSTRSNVRLMRRILDTAGTLWSTGFSGGGVYLCSFRVRDFLFCGFRLTQELRKCSLLCLLVAQWRSEDDQGVPTSE